MGSYAMSDSVFKVLQNMSWHTSMRAMRNRQLVIGLAVGAVIVAAVLIFVVAKSPAEEEESKLQALFLVSLIKNDVFLKGANESDFELIAGEAETQGGSTVRTSETGRSIIEGSEGSVTVVDRNSELTIVASEIGKNNHAASVRKCMVSGGKSV